MLVDKQKQLARVFDMGEYQAVSAGLELAVAEPDSEKTIAIMERMLASIEEICAFHKSPLYEHMTFQPPREEFLAEIRKNLLNNFRDEETFDFLKGNKRWQDLVR